MEKSEIENWIRQTLDDKSGKNYEIDFSGSSGKTDGYMGDVHFVNVRYHENGDNKNLHFVVKIAKQNKAVREIIPIEQFFKEEIFVYQKVFPAFENFQRKKGITCVFNSYPKCIKTIVQPNAEVVILENLKTLGYVLHDRTKALDQNHLKIILAEYGKLHALSFAMKDQQPEEFDNLMKEIIDTVNIQFRAGMFCEIMEKEINTVLGILKNRNEFEIYDRYKKLVEKDLMNQVRQLLHTNSSRVVLSHGDAWSNNYLFLYQNDSPVKTYLLDWQLSTVRCSPVFDLSLFLYCCASSEDMDKIDMHLKHYYKSFSRSLVELGSNPEKLFTFEDLKDDWKQFSLYGAVLAVFILKQTFWDGEDAPDLENICEKDNLKNVVSGIFIKNENYYKRLIAVHRNLVFPEFNK